MLKQPKCPSTDEWIKMWRVCVCICCMCVYVHIIDVSKHTQKYKQWNITQPLKMDEILSFAATWIDLEGIMLSEISQRKINTV